VSANQNGTWKVGIVGTPSVSVNNTVQVSSNGSPFSVELCDQVLADTTCGSIPIPEFVTVPTAVNGAMVKRLVIEFVSGVCLVSGTGSADAVELGTQIQNWFPLLRAPARLQAFAQATRIYANPGSEIGINEIALEGSVTGAHCTEDINGFLETP
jgi:hypothetical protein